MATSFEDVPPDLVPRRIDATGRLPRELVAVTYVIDAGTNQQSTHVFPNGDTLRTGIAFGSQRPTR